VSNHPSSRYEARASPSQERLTLPVLAITRAETLRVYG
jgi:hypothetical protein